MEEYGFIQPIQSFSKKVTWRQCHTFTYDFLERNKDFIMGVYKIPSYNPTDLTRAFIKYMKTERIEPRIETIHNRPVEITNYLGNMVLNQEALV